MYNQKKDETDPGARDLTRMRSNKVAWSTLTKSASQVLSSSSAILEEVSSADLEEAAAAASTCFLQYSITLERILLVTLGRGMPFPAQSSSIMCLIVWDSMATVSSTSKTSPSELFRVIFLSAMAAGIDCRKEGIRGGRNPKRSLIYMISVSQLPNAYSSGCWRGALYIYIYIYT